MKVDAKKCNGAAKKRSDTRPPLLPGDSFVNFANLSVNFASEDTCSSLSCTTKAKIAREFAKKRIKKTSPPPIPIPTIDE